MSTTKPRLAEIARPLNWYVFVESHTGNRVYGPWTTWVDAYDYMTANNAAWQGYWSIAHGAGK